MAKVTKPVPGKRQSVDQAELKTATEAMAPFSRALKNLKDLQADASNKSKLLLAFQDATDGDATTTPANLDSRVFDLTNAQEKVYHGKYQSHKDWDAGRELALALIGDFGWENALAIMAQCARLWAELPHPQKTFTNTDKGVMHGLSTMLGEAMPVARDINRRSRP